jgi:hypothetical protein
MTYVPHDPLDQKAAIPQLETEVNPAPVMDLH